MDGHELSQSPNMTSDKATVGRALTSLHAGTASSASQHHYTRHGSSSSRAALNPGAPPSSSVPSTRASASKRLSDSFSAVLKRPPPVMFWSDKSSVVDNQQRTFFEESTPPPSPSYAADSKGSFSIGYPSAATGRRDGEMDGGVYDYRYDHVAPPAPLPSKGGAGGGSVCGLRKRTFWIVVAAVLLLVLALAIGLGVGLSQSSSSSSSTSGDDEESGKDKAEEDVLPTTTIIKPTITSPIITTETTTTTIATQESTVCPLANDTVYEVPQSPKSFRRLCGVDYKKEDGTKDLTIVFTASMQDCMINCAGYQGCTACGWGPLPGDGYRDNHRCYLKTDLGEPTETKPSWDFAVLI